MSTNTDARICYIPDDIAALGQPSEVAVPNLTPSAPKGQISTRFFASSHVGSGASEPSSTSLAIYAVFHEVPGDSEIVGHTAASRPHGMDDRHALYI